MINYLPNPKSFILQWHITERCNWQCKHCYQGKNYIKDELGTEQLFNILEQYVFLIKKWNIPKQKATLNITGGEPFMRKDFFKFLPEVHKKSNLFRWGLLSNGSFITQSVVEELKSYGIDYYQVSLEGLEECNDEIRGKGSYKKVLRAIRILSNQGVHTNVSLTLTKKNIQQIPELCEILYNAGVFRINTRRLIPLGTGSQLKDELLEPLELKEYYLKTSEMNRTFEKQGKRFNIYIGCESSIFNDKKDNELPKYDCGIYSGRMFTVMPNGDILPCRRLPIKVGNAMEKSLFEVWNSSNKLWELRNLNNAHPFCKNCNNFHQCFGGAKCVTYTHSGKLFVPDVQCWKYYKKLEDSNFFYEFKDDINKELRVDNILRD